MMRVVTNRSRYFAAFGNPLPEAGPAVEVFFGIDNSTALPSVGFELCRRARLHTADRQIDAQVAAVDLEERMWRY